MLLPEDYTLEQLRAHIRKRLGGTVWRLEGMSSSESDLIDQGISGALLEYSRRCPNIGYEKINTNSRKQVYTVSNPGYGVWRVDFIEPVPLVAPLMSNLLGVTPIGRIGGDEVASFLNWRKTFRRVLSCEPKWQWVEQEKKLFIYNVTDFGTACAYTFLPKGFDDISLVHKDFIRRFSIAQVKESLATIRRKFGDLADEAAKEIEALRAELMSFQPRGVPLYD